MMLSDVCLSDVCLTSDVYLSVAYIGPKSRTEGPRKTKFGREVAHVTRDWDTIFKAKRSKVKVRGGGILWRPHHRRHNLLTMALISGADVSMPAFELREDIFNIHRDVN